MTDRTLTEERRQYSERKKREYAASHPDQVTPSRTHVNSTASGLYTGSGMTPERAGADDHKQHSSLNLRAQVRVKTASIQWQCGCASYQPRKSKPGSAQTDRAL